jgi:hypothetical protein
MRCAIDNYNSSPSRPVGAPSAPISYCFGGFASRSHRCTCFAHSLLGANAPGSKLRGRVSRSAESVHAAKTMLAMKPLAMMVLARQLAGWQYQPPAGDQTVLG